MPYKKGELPHGGHGKDPRTLKEWRAAEPLVDAWLSKKRYSAPSGSLRDTGELGRDGVFWSKHSRGQSAGGRNEAAAFQRARRLAQFKTLARPIHSAPICLAQSSRDLPSLMFEMPA